MKNKASLQSTKTSQPKFKSPTRFQSEISTKQSQPNNLKHHQITNQDHNIKQDQTSLISDTLHVTENKSNIHNK